MATRSTEFQQHDGKVDGRVEKSNELRSRLILPTIFKQRDEIQR